MLIDKRNLTNLNIKKLKKNHITIIFNGSSSLSIYRCYCILYG